MRSSHRGRRLRSSAERGQPRPETQPIEITAASSEPLAVDQPVSRSAGGTVFAFRELTGNAPWKSEVGLRLTVSHERRNTRRITELP